MKHEIKLALFPPAPVAAPSGGSEALGTGSPPWPGPMPGPQPSAQREGREKNPSVGPMAIGHQDPLLTVDEFAGQLRVTRACVRRWILERRVTDRENMPRQCLGSSVRLQPED